MGLPSLRKQKRRRPLLLLNRETERQIEVAVDRQGSSFAVRCRLIIEFRTAAGVRRGVDVVNGPVAAVGTPARKQIAGIGRVRNARAPLDGPEVRSALRIWKVQTDARQSRCAVHHTQQTAALAAGQV